MSSTGDFLESEVSFDSGKDYGINAWIVRPCEWYQQEYKDCKSIKARVHQYFIFGETIDCFDWKTDYDNCLKFRKNQNIEHLQKVIESEFKRRETRLQSSKANDIWKYRDRPPKDWLKPLPLWFVQQNQNSFLSLRQNENKTEK